MPNLVKYADDVISFALDNCHLFYFKADKIIPCGANVSLESYLMKNQKPNCYVFRKLEKNER